MSSYQNVVPPLALSSGDVGYSWNKEAFPGPNTAGTQFAITNFEGQAGSGFAVRWQTIFGSAPTALNIVLQGATSDIDANYQTIDASSATAGEARSVPHPGTTATGNVHAKFLRIKVVSSTGGSGLTARILV